jgi:pyridoxal 5'-phosphate synthase pdxT subunit
VKIGVLALQGDFREHAAMLRKIGVEPVEVRLPRDLDGVHGLIIPGGESTTIGKLLVIFDLLEPVRDRARDGFPIYGTCAGAIILAKDVVDGRAVDQPLLGLMDVRIRRNVFGRQVDSFEAEVPITPLGSLPYHAVFIRAPVIESIGPSVDVLGRLADGSIVAAQQGNLLATSFHPELTADGRLHRYFVELAQRYP